MIVFKALLKLPFWWLANIGAALSQLVSALLGGDPDETVSSRLGKARNKGVRWVLPLCSLLDMIHPDHCTKSALWDKDEGTRSLLSRWRNYLEAGK